MVTLCNGRGVGRNGHRLRGRESELRSGQAQGLLGGVLAFPAFYSCSRSPTAVCAQYVPNFPAPPVAIAALGRVRMCRLRLDRRARLLCAVC
jgi:hypothetical protein